MTKSETREVSDLTVARQHGVADAGYVARSLSALVRCAMTAKSKRELLDLARDWAVIDHPDFIA